jgi:hypothetical protein
MQNVLYPPALSSSFHHWGACSFLTLFFLNIQLWQTCMASGFHARESAPRPNNFVFFFSSATLPAPANYFRSAFNLLPFFLFFLLLCEEESLRLRRRPFFFFDENVWRCRLDANV